jgi:hypothetical protein
VPELAALPVKAASRRGSIRCCWRRMPGYPRTPLVDLAAAATPRWPPRQSGAGQRGLSDPSVS